MAKRARTRLHPTFYSRSASRAGTPNAEYVRAFLSHGESRACSIWARLSGRRRVRANERRRVRPHQSTRQRATTWLNCKPAWRLIVVAEAEGWRRLLFVPRFGSTCDKRIITYIGPSTPTESWANCRTPVRNSVLIGEPTGPDFDLTIV